MTTVPTTELQEEVVGALHTLRRDNLLIVCDFLNISGERRIDVERKSRISLVTHVMKYLDREEMLELEDGGMSELLLLKDKVTELATGAVSRAEEDAEMPDTQTERKGQRTLMQN